MLSKEQRLNTKGVALVFGLQRKTTHTSYFKVIIAKPKRLEHKKYAVMVSKKIAPTAVLRNKIRRRVYSSIDKMNISPTPPLSMVVQCLKDSVKLDAKIFYNELEKTVNKALS